MLLALWLEAADARKGLKKPRSGLIALQGHGPQHRPQFRNIRLKPSP